MRRMTLMTGILCICILIPTMRSSGESERKYTPGPFEIYMLLDDTPVWLSDQIRYTLDHTAKVEARFLSVSGEIILLLPIGEQSPGQYTLPFDGTMEGSPFAGLYGFELYFGDDYAAKFNIAVRPLGPI